MTKKQEENVKKIEELQMTEQTLQNLLMQKQVFQLELAETDNSIVFSEAPTFNETWGGGNGRAIGVVETGTNG